MNQYLNKNKEYDLEERIAKFTENIIDFVKTIRKNSINQNIIIQLVRASTSIGANYCEVNDSTSKRDFRNKIFICKKKQMKQNIGLGYWLNITQNQKKT